jgi:hypothetical protein
MLYEAIRRCAVTMVSLVSLGLTSIAQTSPGVGARLGDGLPPEKSGVAVAQRLAAETIAEDSADAPWTRVYIDDAFTGDAARRALRGAAERLAKPSCQLVFSDFQDGRGQPLSDRLVELGASPQGYLRLVVFLDAGPSPQCGKPGVLAFTSRNSRVVYLCGRDFERAERRDPREMQVTIIHELLHSLGLGENPPSPREISFRILRRCV